MRDSICCQGKGEFCGRFCCIINLYGLFFFKIVHDMLSKHLFSIDVIFDPF